MLALAVTVWGFICYVYILWRYGGGEVAYIKWTRRRKLKKGEKQ